MKYDLIQLVLRICSALTAHAAITNDLELKQKCRYTPTELHRMPDPAFVDVANLVHGLALPKIADLGIFFLEQSHLDALNDLIPQFKTAIPGKRTASSVSKVSTQMIQEVIHKNDTLLKETVDSLLEPFQFAHPDFYAAYKNARIIVDYRGGGKVVKEQDEASV